MMVVAGNNKKLGGKSGAGFLPGKSGNPNGRPKIVAEARLKAQAIAAAASPWAVNQLLEIAGNISVDARARVNALNSILDRGCGKVAMAVENADGSKIVGLIVLPAEAAE